MMHVFIKCLAAVYLLASATVASAAVGESPCGRLLSADPVYKVVPGEFLDKPQVQDLATLRTDRFKKPVLLVGPGRAKSDLVQAIVERASLVHVSSYLFDRYNEESPHRQPRGLPFRRADAIIEVVQWQPRGNVIALDWDDTDFFEDSAGEPPNLAVDRLTKAQAFLSTAQKQPASLAIQTMSPEVYAKASRAYPEYIGHFHVIHLE